ncbi:MAG: GT4 family glycosyltransferase PelF, partial [Spirochaetota bacterium]
MTRKLRVCMILEGSYPFITGGVSAWVQDIIMGIPEVDFVLFTISPVADQKLRYTLPANIVEHRDIVLGQRPDTHGRSGTMKDSIRTILEVHGRMFAKGDPDFAGMIAGIPEGFDLTEDSVNDDRAWTLIQRMNEERNPAYPFADYFWAWASAHGMFFDALRGSPPDADIYHAISTGFAGLVALAARVRRGKPFFLSEHGLYHKEREIEIRKSGFLKGYQRDMWIKVYNRLSGVCYRNADAITSLFEENRQKQIELGADPLKCTVIANGIDVGRFSSVVRAP